MIARLATPLRLALALSLAPGTAFLVACERIPYPDEQELERQRLIRTQGGILYGDGHVYIPSPVRDSAFWDVGPTFALANVRLPEETPTGEWTLGGDGAVVFDGVQAWPSAQGPDALTLASSLQTATATWDGSRYDIAGLQAGAVFGADDAAVISIDGLDDLEVPAPPSFADLNDCIGGFAGAQTWVGLPDGAFDSLYVFVAGTGPLGGDAGISRLVAHDDLELIDGHRVTQLIDQETWDVAVAAGLDPSVVTVAAANEVWTDSVWPDHPEVAVQAVTAAQFDWDE